MKYPKDLQEILVYKLHELIDRYKNKDIPFNSDIIKTYESRYNFYKSID